MTTNYKDILKKIYLYSIGSFWIILFIFIRFVRERSDYELNDLKLNVTFELILITIAFIILHLSLIIFSIYLINRNTLSLTTNKYIILVQNFIKVSIIKPLESIRDLIAPKIPGSGLAFCKIADFVEKNLELRSKLLVILFYFLPRVIVAFVFMIEMIFYNKIEYFLYSLMFLLIPISWNVFVNLFTNFGERSLGDIQKNVKVIGIGEPENNGWYTCYKIQALPQFTYELGELEEWSDTWNKAILIYSIGETFFKGFKIKVSPYITILTSSLYLLASIYKLTFLL